MSEKNKPDPIEAAIEKANQAESVAAADPLPEASGTKRRIRAQKMKPKAKVFRESKSDITIKGADRYKREQTEEDKVRIELTASMDPRSRKILTGTVIGYRTGYLNGKPVLLPMADYKGTNILFSPEDFFPNYKETDEFSAIKTRTHSRKASTVNFVVTRMVDDEDGDLHYCVGSRVEAMRRMREKFWFAKTTAKVSGDDAQYFLRQGSVVEANVVSVNKKGIVIEIFGAETFMKSDFLDYGYIADAREKFTAGDTIKVAIMEITRDEKTKSVAFLASRKECVADPREKVFKKYMAGDNVTGVISNIIAKDGKIICFIQLDGCFDMATHLVQGVDMIPTIGQKVSVVIEGKNEEQLRMWGRIIHNYIPAAERGF